MRSTAALLLLLIASAAVAADAPLPRGTIVPRIECASDREESYAVYLPTGYDAAKTWPLLFVFDPRARGELAAGFFRDAAEEHGWILVSSNNTRSDVDWEPNLRAVRAMWKDALPRFSVDPKRIYATGFSGTAGLAWLVGLKTGALAGIIANCGHPLGPSNDKVTFDWYGFTGTTDFNNAEMRKVDAIAAKAGVAHRMEVFDGAHRWAPPELLHAAVDWMEVQAMKRGLRTRDDALIAKTFDADVKAIPTNDELLTLRHLDAIVRTYDGLRDVSELRKRADALRASPAVARLTREEADADSFEDVAKHRLAKAIATYMEGDLMPIAAVINQSGLRELREDAKQNGYHGRAAQRVLSTVDALLSEYRESPRRRVKAMLVAREVHPGDARVLYNLACAYALAGQKRDALDTLEASVAAGFKDAEHIRSDEDFVSLRADERFRRIVDSLAAKSPGPAL